MLSDAGQDNQIRRARILTPAFYVYGSALEILSEIDGIYLQPPSLRPRNYLLISETNNGKTTLLHEFAKRYPGSDSAAAEALELPILIVDCPPKGNLLELYRAILRQLNTPFNPRASASVLFDTVLKMIGACKVRLLILDEFHNLISRNMMTKGAEDFLIQLKYILNSVRIPMVCAGTERAETVARYDDQIWDRFDIGYLPVWKPNTQSTINLLRTMEARWGLYKPCPFTDRDLLKYLITSSKGHIGSLIEMVQTCAAMAVGTTEEVTLDLLQERWDEVLKRKQRKSPFSKP